jgi:hypothetical protein
MGVRNYLIEGVDVFVLDAGIGTLNRRPATRAEGDRGSTSEERAPVARPHRTREDLPADGVDEILRQCRP